MIHRSPCYIVPWELCDTELQASPLEFRRRSALGTFHTFHNRKLGDRSKKEPCYKIEIFNTAIRTLWSDLLLRNLLKHIVQCAV